MRITGIEAHILLFALDSYLLCDKNGRVPEMKDGYSVEHLQSLRDRLFKAHEHPEWGLA